jgi:hypothetical protein
MTRILRYSLFALLVMLVACADEPSPEPTAEEALARYGTDFQRSHLAEGLQFRRVDETSGDVMTTYIVYYTSKQQKYLLDEVASDGDAAYASNSKKMEDWASLFCTPNLRTIMRKYGIDFVMGQVLAPNMRDNDPSKLNAQCGQ